jgi:hypothetical protein
MRLAKNLLDHRESSGQQLRDNLVQVGNICYLLLKLVFPLDKIDSPIPNHVKYVLIPFYVESPIAYEAHLGSSWYLA